MVVVHRHVGQSRLVVVVMLGAVAVVSVAAMAEAVEVGLLPPRPPIVRCRLSRESYHS